ncbi:MAG: serine/threonine protein phosphatase [Sneathiella sp.]|nr:serine/threonine protein phosphatase [Sneathiella sp.]
MFGLFPKKKLRVSLPEGERVIAIGDIHGQKSRYNELMTLVTRYRKKYPRDKESLVFLGDYVDRGPKSATIIEKLIKQKKAAEKNHIEAIFLQGNHETLLLEAIEDRGTRHEMWWRNGGQQTVMSYLKYVEAKLPANPSQRQYLEIFQETFPKKHLRFLESLKDMHRIENLVFVHAGLNMKKKLKEQSVEDMHWIRSPFLDWKGPQKKYMVVHGHSITPRMRPLITDHRISIDTGSYKQRGRITAAIFEDNKVRFISSGTLKEYNKNLFS